MKSGMLWYDPSKKLIVTKIEDAARRYLEKFAVKPDIVFVNPLDFAKHNIDELKKATGIDVRSKQTIMRNHLWLGLEGN